ncbi:MAG: YjbF family lipoprotein [Gallionella sp.]
MTFRVVGLFLVLMVGLAGCAVEPATQAILDAYQIIGSQDALPQPKLNPKLSYLRVAIAGRVAFMVLGYVDSTPQGSVEVWYSAEGDVLKLRDGRVVGVSLKRGVNWLSVTFAHLPKWDAIGDQASFERTHDESPGYRYGIKEKMMIRRINPPEDTQLKRVPVSSLVWYEESVEGGGVGRPSRYALGRDDAHQVVYAEQCLTSKFCFSWQRWPYNHKGMH